jgi:two-component system, LytTR family, sensor kinase
MARRWSVEGAVPSSRESHFWSLQLGGWFALGVAMALSRVGRYPIDYMIATKLVMASLGFGVSLGMRAIYRRWLDEEAGAIRLVGITTTVSYLAALLWTAAYNLADAPLATALLERPVVVSSVGHLFGGTVYHAFALLAWSVLYVSIKRRESLLRERERSLRAEAHAHRATLQALRYQLHPHFLFNTLNAISTLIVEHRTDEASRMVARLSDFLRHTLAGNDAQEVPLVDELEFARQYLAIEQVRFGDRLEVGFDIAEGTRRALVPSLLLQPLVENAIRHGVAPREERATVRISSWRDNGTLCLSVEDDGPGHVVSNGGSTGIGLTNTRARLAHLYGSSAALTLAPGSEGGMRVMVALPYRDGDG